MPYDANSVVKSQSFTKHEMKKEGDGSYKIGTNLDQTKKFVIDVTKPKI